MYDNGTFEATGELRDVLDRVARGEQVTITRGGTPVARLVPLGGTGGQPPGGAEQAIARLKGLRKGRKLGGLSLRGLIEEGRC